MEKWGEVTGVLLVSTKKHGIGSEPGITGVREGGKADLTSDFFWGR